MYFDTFADFIAMGGHGLYVWLAFGVTLVVLLGLVYFPLSKKKRLLAAIALRKHHERGQA